MAVLPTGELVTTDVERSDVFQYQQSSQKPASNRNIVSERDRDRAATRVLRVLVVGTEQDARGAILRRVRYAGHDVHAAADGLTAFRAAVTWNPDVVLLNMKMPHWNACLVARQLRCNCLSEDCLVIAFADSLDNAHYEQCLMAGIDLPLIKPISMEVVETLLMLECARVNRRLAQKAVNKLDGRTSKDYRPVYI